MDVDETIRLIDLGADETNTTLAKFFVESMAEMAAEMWNSREGDRVPTAQDAKDRAGDYAFEMMNEWRDEIVKKIKNMEVRTEYCLELKLLVCSVDPNK